MNQRVKVWLALAACGLAAWTVTVGAREPRSRVVYVTASDGKGGSVPDLTAADFVVKENGKARDVAKVELPAEKMQLALLVEQSLTADSNVRGGLAQFMQSALPRAEISLISVGLRNETLVDYTSSLDGLLAGIARFGLASTSLQSENMGDGIYEAARALVARKAPRPVIVAICFESQQTTGMDPDRVLTELRQSSAMLYVASVTVPSAASSIATMGDQAARGKIVGDGSKQSGGLRVEATVTAAVPRILRQFVDDFARQYKITYTLPDGIKPSDRLSVAVNRKGVSLRAPSRIADK